jgi:hypothetical protein
MRSNRQSRIKAVFIGVILGLAAISLSGCSVPNLETPQCVAARDAAKRFYSFYFGSDMNALENAKALSGFLTNELSSSLAGPKGKIDYFTASENFPKAFRVGACTSDSSDSATLQVVLLWRDDASSDQKEVQVEIVKRGDRWLINKVSS